MRLLFFILVLTSFSFACKKDKNNVPPGEAIEIYTFESSQMVAGKCQVDAAASVLNATPLVRNQDIIDYSKGNHRFRLSAEAVAKVKDLNRIPFALTVDKKVIYYGIFKPIYSSSSCEHSITMGQDGPGNNEVSVRLGYPDGLVIASIEDKRNDGLLLSTLKKQGKLR